MKLSSIHVYPVKSLAGRAQTEAYVTRRGLQMDRRWMLVDEDGDFLSQRECPEMCLIQTSFKNNNLRLTFDRETYTIPLNLPLQAERLWATVWGDEVEVQMVDETVNKWLSDILGTDCRLVYMPETSKRLVNETFATHADDHVSFADGYPVLLTNKASLNLLNTQLERPIGMDRFRPNLVVSGFEPFAEDQWKKVIIGDIPFAVVKPCERCSVITIDPQTAKRGKEPLRTLAKFRNIEGKVTFGQNLIPLREGSLRLGSTVTATVK